MFPLDLDQFTPAHLLPRLVAMTVLHFINLVNFSPQNPFSSWRVSLDS